MQFLDWLLMVVSVLLIGLVMIQESKDDVKNTFSGEKSELFKNQKQRGPELFFARVTMAVSILFAVVTILALIRPF
ncbi:MAG: preprotein translocase subunit SecG [Candidatus Izemoplasmatales bacterium]|jgi:preprotein translocase subunit SecG|nr:preprotein translocase subunit SecG [bacterium]MDZ4197541.1 preprotein translocase subunit SecG [Candidatus Izemoplasmatales bacterium]